MQKGIEIKGQKLDGADVVPCEQVEQIDDNCADHNDLHQIGDAEAGMLIAKFVDFAVDAVQRNTPPNTAENRRSKCADFPIG